MRDLAPQLHLVGGVVALGCLLALAACAEPTGPVLGDWRGRDTAQSLDANVEVEVILDGAPDAMSGTYHYVALMQSADVTGGSRRLDWTDQWHAQPIVVDGRSMRRIHLANLAGPRLGDFILTPDDILVPQSHLASPDLSAAAYRVALQPTPRDSFGYGRP